MKNTLYSILALPLTIGTASGAQEMIGEFVPALVGFFCSLIALIIAIICVIQVLKSDRSTKSKVLWIVVILFVPFGWIIYLLFGRKQNKNAHL